MDRIALSYRRRESFKDSSMFIIGYEGNIKDPKYFYRIEEELIEPRKAFIHPLPPDNGESAPKKVLERVKDFVEDPKRGVDIEPGDNIWFVLDVDRYPKVQFDEVNEYCNMEKQRKLAISNPCFEIWLWMHIEDVDKITSKTSKMLKNELHEKLNSLSFNGDYIPFMKDAIKRAYIADSSKTYYPDSYSTKVHLLVEELLKYSKL